MTPPPPPPPSRARHVAVIGAGAAGLTAIHELSREGHKVTAFEREKQLGGLWLYNQNTDSDPLSKDPSRTHIHSSIYKSLRTNLPRECMGYRDFPFVIESENESRDSRRYPSHQEVLTYLKSYAKEFKIEEMIRFGSEVVKVEFDQGFGNGCQWRVCWRSLKEGFKEDVFDAVVVCNGHFSQPRLAQINGGDLWPGKQIHSHNYRVPDPFKDQIVVVIGYQTSGSDISQDIAPMAKEVHIACRSLASDACEKHSDYKNIWIHPPIDRVCENGSVIFGNGKVVKADAIVHCTGYKYSFPFLETNGYVSVEDNRVGPVYKHVFPPRFAPGLAFIGLPFMSVQFSMFEIQSKWVASVLSGRIKLPSEDKMMEDVENFYKNLEESGFSKRYTHFLTDPSWKLMTEMINPSDTDVISQRNYFNWLADQCGCPHIEHWREELYKIAINSDDDFRDKWDDDKSIEEAYRDFAKLKLTKICYG